MTPSVVDKSSHRRVWVAVPWPVLLVAGLMVAGLLAVSGAYGFHGDEMYYVVAGQHPALGYVDQPPLTPLLSAASVAVLGVSPTAVRVLPAVEVGLIVVLIALMTRDLGGSRRAQVLAAVTAALSGYLAVGHLDTTSEVDLLAWAIVLWLVVKLLGGGDRRAWLAVGAVAGVGLENKDTLLFLGAGLAVGLVLARRWDVVRSPWAWAAVGIALLLWAPNLAWQATHGWPQLTMASRIGGYAADNRAQILPTLWLAAGLLLFPVSGAGWSWMLFAKTAAPWRAIGIAAVAVLVLVVVSGGKAYYGIGIMAPFMAAGAILLDRWLASGRRRLRAMSFSAAAAISGARTVYLTLPILPPAVFAKTSLPTQDPVLAEQIGWPEFVATVEGVVAALPADERARAVILTNDYSEASPLVLLGTGLPPVYSGHNAFWDWGPPPADRTVVVHVGDWRPTDWSQFFVGCRIVARIDNGLGITNGEQGKAISVCTDLRAPWNKMWPSLRTIS
jgi:4-amino-4-deoxy-L-arabinose transferase-like glycosyltransferase